MKNTQDTLFISDFESILKKIKSLKSDTIYSYKALGASSDKLRVYISRLADRGIIVKTARGKFYKPTQMVYIKRSMQELHLNKKLFSNDLFWNVRDGFKIKVDTLLKGYLQNYTQDDLMGLYSLFGYTRLLAECLKLYGNRRNPHYQKIREMLMQFEKWRMDK